jgi:hypothetical protein
MVRLKGFWWKRSAIDKDWRISYKDTPKKTYHIILLRGKKPQIFLDRQTKDGIKTTEVKYHNSIDQGKLF